MRLGVLRPGRYIWYWVRGYSSGRSSTGHVLVEGFRLINSDKGSLFILNEACRRQGSPTIQVRLRWIYAWRPDWLSLVWNIRLETKLRV